MSFNYLPLQIKATGLLQKFGTTATVTREESGTFDPLTGTADIFTTQFSTKVVLLANKEIEQGMIDSVFNTDADTVEQGMYRLLAEAKTYEINDKILFNGTNYRVLSVKYVVPASTILYAELQVRV